MTAKGRLRSVGRRSAGRWEGMATGDVRDAAVVGGRVFVSAPDRDPARHTAIREPWNPSTVSRIPHLRQPSLQLVLSTACAGLAT